MESKNVTYAFLISEFGFLQHLYYGKRIDREDLSYTIACIERGHCSNIVGADRYHSFTDYMNECPTYGRSDYRESVLAFNFNGVRVGDLVYDTHIIYNTKPELQGMPSVKGGRNSCRLA